MPKKRRANEIEGAVAESAPVADESRRRKKNKSERKHVGQLESSKSRLVKCETGSRSGTNEIEQIDHETEVNANIFQNFCHDILRVRGHVQAALLVTFTSEAHYADNPLANRAYAYTRWLLTFRTTVGANRRPDLRNTLKNIRPCRVI